MGRKSGNICILQVDERIISMLRCRRSTKGLQILSFAQEQIAPSHDESGVGRSLKQFIRKHNIAFDDVYTVLPRHEMTVRILILPSHDLNEISGMVRLSAEEHVPYSSSELVIDQCILQRLSDGNARVLAVFAHRDVVERHVQVLTQSGIEPQRIFISTACLASAVFAARGDVAEHTALVNLAPGGIEVLVVKGNVLEYGRAVATPANWSNLHTSEDIQEELAAEVRTSLAVFRRETPDNDPVDRVYVSADYGDPNLAARTLAEKLGIDVVPSRFGASICISQEQEAQTIPLTLLGAALTAQNRASVVIDLVPPSLTEARQRAELRRAAIRVGAFLGALLISIFALYEISLFQRTAYLKQIMHKSEELRPIADEVALKQRNLAALQERINRSGTVLEVLARMSELAPEEGLTFTKLTYDSRKGVILQGRASDLAVVNRFSNTLRRAARPEEPWLAEARQGKSAEVQERGVTVQQFEIEIPFLEKPVTETTTSEENFAE